MMYLSERELYNHDYVSHNQRVLWNYDGIMMA